MVLLVAMRAEPGRAAIPGSSPGQAVAAIALDRVQRRRRETAWHVALVLLLLAVALPVLGAELARLLLALRLL